MSFSSMFWLLRKSDTAFDFFELSSCAVFEVADSVTMDREMTATSGLARTLPSPLKDTVLVVAAVFTTLSVLASKNIARITITVVPDQMSGLNCVFMIQIYHINGKA